MSRTVLTAPAPALALALTVAWVSSVGCATKKPGADRTLVVVIHPVHPITGSTVATHRPRVRWAALDSAHGYTVRFCRDRGCTVTLTTVETADTVVSPTEALPQGLVFWRVEETVGARVSPVGYFIVGAGAGMNPSDLSSQSRLRVDPDGDGRADVVTGPGDVRVWQPSGPAGTPWATLQRPGRVCTSAGDVDGNGVPDVACADGAGSGGRGELAIYLGPLSPGVVLPSRVVVGPDEPPAGFGAEGSFAGAIAGDFNADGYTDLAVSSPAVEGHRGRIHVLAGSPTGIDGTVSKTLESPFGMGGEFRAMAAADVDGDGADDLLVSAVGTAVPQTVYLALHRGGVGGVETFPLWVAHDLGAVSVQDTDLSASMADVTGDGLVDVVLGRPVDQDLHGCVSVFGGQTDGPAVSPTQRICSADAAGDQFGTSLDAGDLDGDGVADVASVVFSPHVVLSRRCLVYRGGSVLRPLGTGEVRGPTETADQYTATQIADMDGDGVADLAILVHDMNQAWAETWFQGTSMGLSATSWQVQ